MLKLLKNKEKEIKKREINGHINFALSKGCGHPTFKNLLEIAESKKNESQWDTIRRLVSVRNELRLLDFGSGNCWASYQFAKEGCDVVALDMNLSDVVGLKAGSILANGTGVQFKRVCGDCERMPLKNNLFDVVFCYQTLHHAYDLEKMVNEVVRTLKKGGKFLAVYEQTRPITAITDTEFRKNKIVTEYGIYERAYWLSRYKRILKNAGIVNIICLPASPYDEVFQKMHVSFLFRSCVMNKPFFMVTHNLRSIRNLILNKLWQNQKGLAICRFFANHFCYGSFSLYGIKK
jgi:ubiquinone/menaquinone biosynthesis C-methylase UbiE